MKKLFVVLAVAAVIALVAAGAAMAGIVNTKHNLANTATTNTYYSTNTDEVCVFCHTPHQTGTATQPLWNRTVPANAFTPYGTTLAGTNVSSFSATIDARMRLCFSCHDGVTALNALNNPPNDAGAQVNMVNGNNFIVGQAVLDFDLTNDHPVGITYTNGVASLRTLTVNATTVVRIVGANNVEGTSGTSLVLCSSCHEPHREASAFLAVANDASALCITCHMK